MKPATTKAAAKRQPTCPECKKRFRTTSRTKKFCNTLCSQSFRNEARRVKYLFNATNSPFFQELARQAVRARTLLIYKDFSQDGLEALYDVYAACQKMNGYGLRKEYGEAQFEISHIAPVRGKACVGLFRADNLVIAPMALNRAHGTKHFAGGASMALTDLSSRFALEKDANHADVIQRIIKLIGEKVVMAVVKSKKIQPSKRQALYSWLVDNLDPANPDHAKHLDTIETATARVLAGIKRELEGKESATDFRVFLSFHDDTSVLMSEWERVGKAYRPEILPALERLQFLDANTNTRFRLGFDSIDTQLVFDMLHGKPAYTVESMIDALYAKALASPVLYQPAEALLQTVQPTVQAPAVRKSVTLSFLEELDSLVEQVAPIALVVANSVPVEEPCFIVRASS
ncbi:hypothetical protein [Pseudomonas sp. MF6768]|uniref:hypothetical protein n=1 Tax=Pseudomonas sp. MF6768 TaxID=2797532 RepID=UPI0018E8B160|nr:hypothetical protein [Pseudomonas sp. MF6768]MBJ2242508.1 hypothetical protein [Pseudomonas sp. MF6768]